MRGQDRRSYEMGGDQRRGDKKRWGGGRRRMKWSEFEKDGDGIKWIKKGEEKLPSASEVMLSGAGQMSETCSRSLRSLLIVLANTSSLRARWKGSSIIMPEFIVENAQCSLRQASIANTTSSRVGINIDTAGWECGLEWECVCRTYFLYAEQRPCDDGNEGHHVWSCAW